MFFKRVFDDSKLMQEIYNNRRLNRYFMFLVGVCLQAIAFNLFLLPSNLVAGLSGIAIVINHVFHVNPAFVILLGNLLLLLASFAFLGSEVTRRTILGAILYPLLVELTAFLPLYVNLGNTEPVIVAMTGAVIYGFGTGLIFKGGFTTGGSDIVKQIVSKYMKVSIGQSIIYVEAVIVILGVFVFGWQSFIYSVIALMIISYMTDKVVIGISNYKTFQIMTSEAKEIEQFIINQLHHGVTVINNRSGFTESKKKILMCTLPTREYYVLKEAILRIDKNAFFIVTDTYEVQGEE